MALFLAIRDYKKNNVKQQDEKGLQFSINFEGNPNEKIPIAAHVFDKAGNHIVMRHALTNDSK